MKHYEFEKVKYHSDNTSFNNRILLCNDYRSTITNVFPDIHSHDFYEIEYVFNGEGVAILNNKSYLLKAGTVVIIKPQDMHSYFSTNNLAVANICLLPNESQKHFFDVFQHVVFDFTEDEKYEFELIYHLLDNCLKLNKENLGRKANSYVDLLIIIISSIYETQSHSINHWNDLLYYIAENYSTVTLEEAAKILHLSIGAFCRKFKKEFSVTFTQYIDNVRLEKAKELLLTSNLSIESISEHIGFSHVSRFYRSFKSLTNMTPKEFKKINKLHTN